jgi:hypothetical protein
MAFQSLCFPFFNEPQNPPNFADDKVHARNQEYLQQPHPVGKQQDILQAYMQYKDGALHKAVVIYATIEVMKSRAGGIMPYDFNGEAMPLSTQPWGSYAWRSCKREMSCLLPHLFIHHLSPDEVTSVILGYMNLYANDRVATQNGDHVLVPGMMLSNWLEVWHGGVGVPTCRIKDTHMLLPWFASLTKAGWPYLLRLHGSPLQVLLDHIQNGGWAVIDRKPASAPGGDDGLGDDELEDEASNPFRCPLKKTFDAIHYLQAPAQNTTFPGSESGYLAELHELHSYSKERYDGIIENLYASAEQALKAWATAAPETLPCLAEAENWAISARRVAGNGALIRAALSLVERVATECGRNQGRVMSSRAKTMLSNERWARKDGHKHLKN